MIEPSHLEHRPRVVVVGGAARSAQAFRSYASNSGAFDIVVLTRRPVELLSREKSAVVSDYFSPPHEILADADTIVNFVGITTPARDEDFQRLNVEGPARLARLAMQAGVKHFVQLSSLHVYGETESIGRETPEAPLSSYARSKLAGDRELMGVATDGFIVTNLRMPMHYGFGAGEKLQRLAGFMARYGWFPVRRERARRSVVHLTNLAAAILFLVENRIGGIQFMADAEPFTIESLADIASKKLGQPIRLIEVPEIFYWPLRAFAAGIYSRLYRSNVIRGDDLLKVSCPISLQDGLMDILP